MDNKEISYVKQILGLQHGKEYADVKSLRYGQLMIMTDQDHDGSHIKGLLINFLHAHFPSLLKARAWMRVDARVVWRCGYVSDVIAVRPPSRPPLDPLRTPFRSPTFWWSSSRPSSRPPRASNVSCSTPCLSACPRSCACRVM
jgi:hypothetical protein